MIGHEIITASAGAGKTWSLTVRYIRLLALGAAPASIIALTFSRKAAGEFFTAILHRLALAGAQDSEAARLARDIELPQLGRKDFVRLLAAMVRDMPQLTLGTLDSFFVRIARSFPLELGLTSDFALLDDHQRRVEQGRVLARVFAPGTVKAEEQRAFLEAFKQATWGKDEVKLRQLLDDFIDAWHGLFLIVPQDEKWGQPSRIWRGHRGLTLPPEPMPNLITAAVRALHTLALTAAQREKLESLLAGIGRHTPGTPPDKSWKSMLGKCLEVFADLPRGAVEITINRKKVELAPPFSDRLYDVLCRFVHDTLMVCLHQTAGIHRLLSIYDLTYHDHVRRQGRLTFQDVQFYLSGDIGEESGGGWMREGIDYRLDARYDHWMLDEFQDTSRVQWRVIQNLCDEAIQDAEGKRTFFAVGDEKQSIFTWRGAEPGLFGEIMAHYAGRIAERPLALSQRSGPPVISMVNRLYGDRRRLAELGGLEKAVQRWPWKEHTSAHPERTGCGLLLEVPVGKEEDKDEAVWGACAEWLLQNEPLRRGLTVAVICHRNKRAAKIADFLRARAGAEVVCESDVKIAEDNPANTSLLAMLKAAAHPGDDYSWQHVSMSPLGGTIALEWPGEGETEVARARSRRIPFTMALLDSVAAEGFEKTLRKWICRLLHEEPGIDGFSRGRTEELCRAAQEFDAGGSRDVDEFLEFAAAWTVRESSHPRAVQVMTLHKSKGLTFDIVLLPDLHDKSMFQHHQRIGIGRGAQREIDWLTLLPGKDIAAADPVIADALEEMEAQQWRERLAQLYVAVTRARRANYLILPPASENSESVTMARLVRHMLTQGAQGTMNFGGRDCEVLSADGDPDWMQAVSFIRDVRTSPVVETDLFAMEPGSAGKPAPRVRPSDRTRPWKGRRIAARREARRFGVLVHELLQRVERAAPDTPELLLRWFRLSHQKPEAWQHEALDCALRCLRETGSAFTGGTEIWRERPFEAIIDGALVSGVFDRVVLERTGGAVASVHVYEFKTDHFECDAAAARERHGGQSSLYRKAAALLTGLRVEQVRVSLLMASSRPLPLLVEATPESLL